MRSGEAREERSLSQAEVTSAVAEMRRTVAQDGSGTFDQQVVSDFPGFFVEKSSDVEWALEPNRWEMTMEFRGSDGGSAAELEGGRITFRVADDGMFITSPEWTGNQAGKWMSFSKEQLEASTGLDIPLASTRAPPPAVLALLTFRGESGSQTSEGVELTGRVPFGVFSQLVGLSGRVAAQIPNLREVLPVREVRVTLDPDGRPRTLTIARGDPPALPTSGTAPTVEDAVPLLVEATETTVEYLEWGIAVEITAPSAADITQGR